MNYFFLKKGKIKIINLLISMEYKIEGMMTLLEISTLLLIYLVNYLLHKNMFILKLK